jgi:PDZ domain-containing protein
MTGVSFKRFLRIAPVVLLLAVVVVGSLVPLPYYAIGPGPAQEVEPLIHLDGPTVYASAGKLVMTTVSFKQVTGLEAAFAWLDPHRSLVAQDVLYPSGETQDQEQQRSLSQMDTSKIDAASVVLRQTGDYPKQHGAGALIESVGPGCPAEGRLFAGDLVTAIDGTPVRTVDQAQKLLDAVPTDARATFEIRAAGATHTIPVTRGTCIPGRPPLFGISMIANFPYRIRIESGDLGGPSAGLMWALGMDDLLTPGDLTGGKVIAGTGTIDLAGKVGPIGGIGDKVVAAQSVGADVFLVPKDDLKGAQAASDGSMRIVPVGSFQQALAAIGSL